MKNKIKRIWKGFWQLADPKIWIASTVPISVGAAVSYTLRDNFNLYWFLMSLIGIYFIEIGKNAINEIVDFQSGVDRFVTSEKRTPFSGGKKTIVDKLLFINEVKIIAVLTMLAGLVIGLYITFFHEIKILYVAVPGFILAILYSLPPFKLCYRGWGEYFKNFPDKVVKKQGNVDAISGATHSYHSYNAALDMAMKQADLK